MGLDNGSVVGIKRIHGWSGAFNIAILGDGYTASELKTFHAQAKELKDHLFATAPFDRPEVQKAICIYRIDTTSTHSGVKDPVGCSDGKGSGSAPRTYFDSTRCGDGQIGRLITTDKYIVNSTLRAWKVVAHAKVVLVNSPTTYGGSGGEVAVVSTNGDWKGVFMHELGHSPFGLADEYASYTKYAGHGTYAGSEPAQPNVTAVKKQDAVKWRTLLTRETPTLPNNDCSKLPQAPDPYAGKMRVGLYEGAQYYQCGLYRPVFDCMMRTTGRPFCPVCEAKILQDLAPYIGHTRAGMANDIYLDLCVTWTGCVGGPIGGFPPLAPAYSLSAEDLSLSDGQVVNSWNGITPVGAPKYDGVQGRSPTGRGAVSFKGTAHLGKLAVSSMPHSPRGEFVIAAAICPDKTNARQYIIGDDESLGPSLYIEGGRYTLNAQTDKSLAIGTGINGWDIVVADSGNNRILLNGYTVWKGNDGTDYLGQGSLGLLNRNGHDTFQGMVGEIRIYTNLI